MFTEFPLSRKKTMQSKKPAKPTVKRKSLSSQYHIRASLANPGSSKKSSIFRGLLIPGSRSLYDLANSILRAYDFDFDHAFGFYNGLKHWTDSTEGYELFADVGEKDQFPGVKKTRIHDVYTVPGKKMLFLFDYGDEWQFLTELIEIKDNLPIKRGLNLIESSGIAPLQYPIDEEN